MGLNHCVPSSCATVNYREYLGGKIRWRYGTEPWQEILGTGLTYTTKVSNNLVGTGPFKAITQSAVRGSSFTGFSGWQPEVTSSCLFSYTTIDNFCLTAPVLSTACLPNNEFHVWMLPANQFRDHGTRIQIWANGTTYLYSLGTSQGIKLVDFIPCDLSRQKKKCDFKIFKAGVEIRSETRATCPEVQIVSCTLSTEAKAIAIKKTPYLSSIDVIPYGKSAKKVSGVPYPLPDIFPIPSECLNIYKNDILDPLPNQVNGQNDPVFSDFAGQICSSPGCPPPQYDVACDDCCQSCPNGTCPVECGGQICCYDADGVSVKAIALNNYCRG